jgi:hypothetical protein
VPVPACLCDDECVIPLRFSANEKIFLLIPGVVFREKNFFKSNICSALDKTATKSISKSQSREKYFFTQKRALPIKNT